MEKFNVLQIYNCMFKIVEIVLSWCFKMLANAGAIGRVHRINILLIHTATSKSFVAIVM